MYHSVHPGNGSPEWTWAVSHKRFCQQLDLLIQNGCKTALIRDLIGAKKYAAKTVIITFDDGYADNYAAFEALKDRGMCAVWFMVTNDIGGSSSWVDPGVGNQALLDQGALCEFASTGMEVASHTCSHRRMPQMSDTDLANELVQSKRQLEDILGQEVESFAYPYGAYDGRCVQAVRDAGYKLACTTKTGWALAGGDLFTLRRVSIFANDTVGAFARKLAFATNDVGLEMMARYYRRRFFQRFSGRVDL